MCACIVLHMTEQQCTPCARVAINWSICTRLNDMVSLMKNDYQLRTLHAFHRWTFYSTTTVCATCVWHLQADLTPNTSNLSRVLTNLIMHSNWRWKKKEKKARNWWGCVIPSTLKENLQKKKKKLHTWIFNETSFGLCIIIIMKMSADGEGGSSARDGRSVCENAAH